MKIKRIVRRSPFIWRYWRNLKACLNYRSSYLDLIHKGTIDKLCRDGIAFISFSELFENVDFEAFRKAVTEEIQLFENIGKSTEDEQKKYFDFILGLNPHFEAESIWNKVASHPNLQALSDAYFRMKGTKMRYYNIWRHRPFSDEPTGSQLWHRDREDLKILKVFICLEDVEEQTGPFYYAPGTQLGGKVKKNPETYKEPDGTHRTTDAMMEKVVPREKWISAIGKKGTVVLADTHGYHKGGFVKEGERLLFTCMYVSPACGRVYFQ
jgi:hypothetical protein